EILSVLDSEPAPDGVLVTEISFCRRLGQYDGKRPPQHTRGIAPQKMETKKIEKIAIRIDQLPFLAKILFRRHRVLYGHRLADRNHTQPGLHITVGLPNK